MPSSGANGNGICDFEILPFRQADDPRQHQLVDRELVFGGDQPLLLRLQLHAGAQHVDAAITPALF